jgi:uncharacterized protein YndB with AHSA1/START domain
LIPSKADVTVVTTVAVTPAEAFRVFTEEIDAWWGRGRAYRFNQGDSGMMRFLPGPTGSLVEEGPGGTFQIGRVLTWDPGALLVFEWRARNFAPDESTEVEITFEAIPSGTKVTLRHRGLTRLRLDHPARHGSEDQAFIAMLGRYWARLLMSMRARALGG